MAIYCKNDNLLSTGDIMKAFLQLLVVQTFRPDRLLAMGHIFVAAIMGDDFQQDAEQDPNLAVVVEEEVRNSARVCTLAKNVFLDQAKHSCVVVFRGWF